MNSRIIWTFRNNEHSAVALRSASSAGAAHAARPVVLPPDGRAAPCFIPPRDSSPRGDLARSLGRAPLFDATDGRWIVPPSRMTRDAGAAADLRLPDTREDPTHSPVLRGCRGSSASRPAVVPPMQAAGPFFEAFTVALGMTVFGAIAYLFLVL